MSQQLVAIKKRIKSVTGAYKVTSAMKLVSTVKLKRWKEKMLTNKAYFDELSSIADEILSYCEDLESPYLSFNKKTKKNLYIIVTSNLGLCGAYNNNVIKLADEIISKEDDLIILGKKGITHFKDYVNKIDASFYSSNIDQNLVKEITNYCLTNFDNGTYRSIHILHSRYKNSLNFIPSDFRLLPLNKKKVKKEEIPPILEPSKEKLVRDLINFYLTGIINSKLLESEVCEQAARSNAMENATDNAKEILDDLNIQFNKARQAAITDEIIEIVAASKGV